MDIFFEIAFFKLRAIVTSISAGPVRASTRVLDRTNESSMLERRDPEVWDVLEEVIYQHPVMLNLCHDFDDSVIALMLLCGILRPAHLRGVLRPHRVVARYRCFLCDATPLRYDAHPECYTTDRDGLTRPCHVAMQEAANRPRSLGDLAALAVRSHMRIDRKAALTRDYWLNLSFGIGLPPHLNLQISVYFAPVVFPVIQRLLNRDVISPYEKFRQMYPRGR
ncbi:MAG: hypothetical protein IH795_05650, partial [Bacteroidetes bacterium]|nr:hypothetical protein [Bacteroidota bacterium]